jgi:hypothetical protein
MKKFFIAFAVFLLWSLFGLWLYSWLKPNSDTAKVNDDVIENTTAADSLTKKEENLLDDDAIIPILAIEDSVFVAHENQKEIAAVPSGLKALTDEGDVIFLYPEGIKITKNSAELIIPHKTLDFKYKLNSYMLEHPDQEIHISSLYSATENIQSPNLGIQRGKKIKEILMQVGIPNEKIVVKPFIKEIQFKADNTFSNSFTFSIKPLDKSRIETLKNKIPESRIVYPDFSDMGIMVNENLKLLLDEVVQIVAENPDIQIEVIGHTDNVGNANDNYLMGLQFARQTRWYLINRGKIDNKKIRATSKGEAEPLDTNQTDSGRNANRRIELKFYLNK